MSVTPFRSLSVGNRLFDIPGAPTVGRASSGRFTKLSDELVAYYKKVAADAINDYTDKIAYASLREVPKGPREDEQGRPRAHGGDFEEGSLAGSLRAPFNDPESRATEEFLSASVAYDTPYAGVQHEGIAIMVHHHPIIGARGGFFFEKEGAEREITIEWRAQNYTTPGTKDHYLSDPFKSFVPGFEDFMYQRVRKAFSG